MAIDYSKGQIYIIKNHNNGIVYIGSTTQSLCQRFAGHKRSCNDKRYNHRPMYQHMKEYGCDTFYIQLLEHVNAKDKNELLQVEGKYIKDFHSKGIDLYNKDVAGRDKKQYYFDNKYEINAKHHEYREANREKIKAKRREYYYENKDEINAKAYEYRKHHRDERCVYDKQYRLQNKDKVAKRKKQYREQHKDKILEYLNANKDKIVERSKQYHEANKDKINAKKSEKVTCKICNSTVSRDGLARHNKTISHITNFIQY